MNVEGLKCEGRSDPLGVDEARPRLGWALQSPERGARQTAYRILVASSRALLADDQGDVWDSGKVASGDQQHIACAGRPLRSSQQVFWKVRVWDAAGEASAWSVPGTWTMGILVARDWRAAWISAPGLEQGVPHGLTLRREFDVKPGLRRAVAHVTGLGHYEMSLNGAKVGNALLTPGWTDYRDTVLYDTYEVTSMLREGANAAGLSLGNGMYHVEKRPGRYNKFDGSFGPPRALAQIRLEYRDGSTDWVATDRRWRTHRGPLVYSDVYGGEDHDARLDPRGWRLPGFDAAGWDPAEETAGPGGALKGLSVAGLPIRAVETLAPKARTRIRPGVDVYDLGQNAPLIPRITVSGPAGAVVRIVPSELIRESGEIDDTMCGGRSFWTYTLAGHGEETWRPAFFYRGARYLQVECLPAVEDGPRPKVHALAGLVVHADAPVVGAFACSSGLFNRVHELVRWAQRGNMMSVLTDCPHREKLGWLEETYLNGPALRYNFGLDPLFAKVVNDIRDAQLDSGLVPNIAPEYTVFGWWGDMQFRETAEWGSAYIQIPRQQLLFSGDLELARGHYDGMKRYLAYLGTHVKDDGILRIPGSLGDWYDIGPRPPGLAQLTPVDLTATATYYDNARSMAAFAAQLGRPADARAFREATERTRRAFGREYFNPARGDYATGSQTANAMPLALGMVDPDRRDGVLAALVEDVGHHGLTAGDVGYRYLLRALADGGRSDVVLAMNHQSDKPGYGMQLARGATSLTEAWDARRASSQNHFMLGQINEWFFHDLAGIQPDPDGPGFRRVVIRPACVDGLTWVRAHYDAPAGRIRSAWSRADGTLTVDVTIPPNTTARVHVPAADPATVREGGSPLDRAPHVRRLGRVQGAVVLAVPSGTYRFTAPDTSNQAR